MSLRAALTVALGLAIAPSCCRAWTFGKLEFVNLLTSATSPSDFTGLVTKAVRRENPFYPTDTLHQFLDDLYIACPKTLPFDEYYLYAQDIAELQETCRLLVEIGVTDLKSGELPRVGNKLMVTSMKDFRSTEKMLDAAQRVFDNASEGAKGLSVNKELKKQISKLINKGVGFVAIEYSDSAFDMYPAAMTAARLFERLVALTALSNKVNAEESVNLKFNESGGTAKYRKPRPTTGKKVATRRTIKLSETETIQRDLNHILNQTEAFRAAHRGSNALNVAESKAGRGRLRKAFHVKRVDVLNALQMPVTRDAAFMHSFAPWLSHGASVPCGEMCKARNDVLALFHEVNEDGEEGSDAANERREKLPELAEDITRIVNKFVDSNEASTRNGDLKLLESGDYHQRSQTRRRSSRSGSRSGSREDLSQ